MEQNEQRILQSWQRNAVSWSRAVRAGAIDSRRQVTDQAIVQAISDYQPQSVIDIGCGEGWLARELHLRGMEVTGIDATPALVDAANKSGKGSFYCVEYTQLSSIAQYANGPFDMAVCNFSLLGDSSTQAVIAQLRDLVKPKGYALIQTLHPRECAGKQLYKDGWRETSWEGFDGSFTDPAPWFFRTIHSWRALFQRNDFSLQEVREPVFPNSGRAASVIFIITQQPYG